MSSFQTSISSAGNGPQETVWINKISTSWTTVGSTGTSAVGQGGGAVTVTGAGAAYSTSDKIALGVGTGIGIGLPATLARIFVCWWTVIKTV